MVPEPARDEIISFQRSISKLPATCKMVEPQNLHVCLSFLGDFDESEVGRTSKALERICSHYKSFEVDIGKIKLIPSENYVRVVVLDMSSKSGSLVKISAEIKERVGGSVKPPHITLCRVRRISDKSKFLEVVKGLDASESKFAIDSVSIIKSELSPSGPTYSIIKKIKL
jgi:2'-5' RNA ligase